MSDPRRESGAGGGDDLSVLRLHQLPYGFEQRQPGVVEVAVMTPSIGEVRVVSRWVSRAPPLPMPSPYTTNLVNNISRLKLNVDKVVHIHGGSSPYSDVLVPWSFSWIQAFPGANWPQYFSWLNQCVRTT